MARYLGRYLGSTRPVRHSVSKTKQSNNRKIDCTQGMALEVVFWPPHGCKHMCTYIPKHTGICTHPSTQESVHTEVAEMGIIVINWSITLRLLALLGEEI